jgi:type I restriction enzyme M protein
MVRAPTELSAEDIGGIADACNAWRGEVAGFKPSEDVPAFGRRTCPGFCAAADLDAIRGHHHVLIPGQCVGSDAAEGDGEPLDEKIGRLTAGIGG